MLEYRMFYALYPFVAYLLTLPREKIVSYFLASTITCMYMWVWVLMWCMWVCVSHKEEFAFVFQL
jgi:uncharacterized membrane protein YccF (DUF307 family)